jgi:DNA-binding transcriptional regulator YiaG
MGTARSDEFMSDERAEQMLSISQSSQRKWDNHEKHPRQKQLRTLKV